MKVFIFEVYDFLTIHFTCLELEQALKDFLNLEIYRAFIKLLDQTKRKTKKTQKGERGIEIERMRKESQMEIQIYWL